MGIVASGGRPNARQTWHSLCRYCEINAGTDQDFFETADEFDCAQRFPLAVGSGEATQIEYGIANDLAGAVERNVTAAVAFEKLNAALGKQLGRGDDVCSFRITAERNDRSVFEQKKNVANFFFFAKTYELLL